MTAARLSVAARSKAALPAVAATMGPAYHPAAPFHSAGVHRQPSTDRRFRMSIEAVQAFRDRVANDSALQKTCADAIQREDFQRVVTAGAALGFEFTGVEVQQCLASEELSDQELELVAGGGNKGGQFPAGTTLPRNMT
ncbi:MAG: Nif11-like leader peptide family natural product precursor [Comamonadaceae bacterium]|nr:MAG: Nif11-like leader peptide family natural product precursor [Comamonadaceae bacterium]